jgi:hypothetical protein
MCVAPSQMGVMPEQSELLTQPTHRPVDALQTGVVPPQAVVFVTEHWPQAPEGSQAGVVPPQSASPAQGTHVWVVMSQVGVVPPHCAFEVHATHRPAATSQAARGNTHFAAFDAEHSTHAPVGLQAGAAAVHSASPAQARQLWDVRLQTGVVPPHCALLVQATQVPVGRLQTGVAAVHWLALVAEHWPHTPEGWQAGADGPQSVSPAQPRQVCVPPSQIGVALGQSAALRHPTQAPITMSHRGVAPVHWVLFVAEHCVHAPLAWQAGVVPPHSPSPAQARHACVVVSHTGFMPPQLTLLVQDTQVPPPISQAGVGLTHAVALLAEHWPQAPDAWHAGAEAFNIVHSPSAPQARQVWLVPSQTGVVPPHSAPETQLTHVPDGT